GPEAEQVIALAWAEARRLDTPAVDVEHLLLGLLREGDSIAARVLVSSGVTRERVRQALQQDSSSEDEPEEPPTAIIDAPSAAFAALLSSRLEPPEPFAEFTFSRPEPFAALTQTAQRVLVNAQDEAERANYRYVNTEHLLIGLLREPEGVAARLLATLGIDLAKVRSAVTLITGRGAAKPRPAGATRLGPQARQALEHAAAEAQRRGQPYVGTGHLLFGLVRHGGGIAAGVLESLGVPLERVQAALDQELSTAGAPPEPPPDPAQPVTLPPWATMTPRPMIPDAERLDVGMPRFTAPAQRVLAVAEDEARLFHHPYIGTEHLLIGLVHEPEGLAARVLANLGITDQEVRAAVRHFREPGHQRIKDPIAWNPGARQVLDRAAAEARALGQEDAGPEHLLLALIRTAEGLGGQVLEYLGVAPDWALGDLLRELNRQGPLPPDNPPPGVLFHKFTQPARAALAAAQEEAQRCNHSHIGTEHLLLGLLRDPHSLAGRALIDLGLDLTSVRSVVDFILGRHTPILGSAIGLTPRAKQVIALAVDEAGRLGHHHIGPEHLLLGLAEEREGLVVPVLAGLGVSPAAVRRQVLYLLNVGDPPA
ncbi:MAG TPA: Clp protease N-terminal domain-containing protein, partial [Chloroflexia bacterium]|nr:Clp protease N-terminal domain-containing protein [Chloroflexia bacterium]